MSVYEMLSGVVHEILNLYLMSSQLHYDIKYIYLHVNVKVFVKL